MAVAHDGTGAGGSRPREFEGKTNREYRGDANGGGWRRWARGYILSNPSLAPEARGPRLLNLMKEGSPAAKATRHLQPDQLAMPGGDSTLISVLDKRYPKTPDHVNLREVMDELNASMRTMASPRRPWWAASGRWWAGQRHRTFGTAPRPGA